MQYQSFIDLVAAGALPVDAYLQTVNPEAAPEEAAAQSAQLARQYAPEIEDKADELNYEQAMEQIEPQHRLFIELVAKGMKITDAYQRTVGADSTRESCSANGSRLFTRYKTEIVWASRRHRKNFQNELKRYAEQNPGALLNDADVVQRLCSIIKGESGLNGDEFCVPTYPDMLRAIELHLRMTGKMTAKNYNDAQKGTIVRTIK